MRHQRYHAGSRSATASLIYSVPRKLDLASLFVFTLCYGILFAIMIAFHFKALSFALVAGFLTSVGISQAVLFGGKAPRIASSITGSAFYFALFVLSPFFFGTPWNRMADVSVLIPFLVFGLAMGYFSGVCIAGVILTTDQLRKWRRSVRILSKESAIGDFGNKVDFGGPEKKVGSFDEIS